MMVVRRLIGQVHRHAGGLEMSCKKLMCNHLVHRHAGGLENCRQFSGPPDGVHRHAGGLEMAYAALA